MKILHIGLASHFTVGMNYQDEVMPYCNCNEGYSVTFMSDAYSFKGGEFVYTGEENIILENGMRLIRGGF